MAAFITGFHKPSELASSMDLYLYSGHRCFAARGFDSKHRPKKVVSRGSHHCFAHGSSMVVHGHCVCSAKPQILYEVDKYRGHHFRCVCIHHRLRDLSHMQQQAMPSRCSEQINSVIGARVGLC